MYGCILKILSSFYRKPDKSISKVDIGYDLGRDLINNYYYIEYLSVKKTKDKNYYLSNWKSENKHILVKF